MILDGVETVPVKATGTPGVLAVSGEQAEPILTANTERDVFIAAAEKGYGRIVVFAHDTYSECKCHIEILILITNESILQLYNPFFNCRKIDL